MDASADRFRVNAPQRSRGGASLGAGPGPVARQTQTPEMDFRPDIGAVVEHINVTSSVSPGGVVDVEVPLKSTVGSIKGDHPDCCGLSCHGFPIGSSTNGYLYNVEVCPEWESCDDTSDTCLDVVVGVGGHTDDWAFDFDAPEEEGGYNIDITVTFPGSNTSRSVTMSTAVESGGGVRPGPGDCAGDDDCSGGQECVNGSCRTTPGNGGGPGGIIDRIIGTVTSPLDAVGNIVTVVVVLVVLYFAARLYLSRGSKSGQVVVQT